MYFFIAISLRKHAIEALCAVCVFSFAFLIVYIYFVRPYERWTKRFVVFIFMFGSSYNFTFVWMQTAVIQPLSTATTTLTTATTTDSPKNTLILEQSYKMYCLHLFNQFPAKLNIRLRFLLLGSCHVCQFNLCNTFKLYPQWFLYQNRAKRYAKV